MGAIIDILFVGKTGIRTVLEKYPGCVVRKMADSHRKYRIIIPHHEPEEEYYNFLVDARMALASSNFRMRMQSDARFKERMILRANAARNGEPASI
ncbi:hypothetical protein M1B72_13450 [Geomonas paludis]|uniref:Uncharacterized protein n=1 Tax=Geomonas paludis TaxID=2740185 RepID=A0ABY4L9L8_9BACT|nr:hypothetical protein [Geomonas paludis]UPU34454.1 hypothetical protein M1B72_13450 [Geomonas paludis]